jgi:hypothetical protein
MSGDHGMMSIFALQFISPPPASSEPRIPPTQAPTDRPRNRA